VLCAERRQSKESIAKASEAGLVCVELDLRLTSDGQVGKRSCDPNGTSRLIHRESSFTTTVSAGARMWRNTSGDQVSGRGTLRW
jgi:hypothetical protein